MDTLGRYEIHEEIGRGAMGIVSRGTDPKINRPVALKCLHAHLVEGHEGIGKRFQQEMLALGRLIHPNIVTIFDAGEDEASGRSYIVMEYVEGVSLAQLIKDGRDLSLGQILQIGILICRGLHFAHARNIVHRDIKPGNILLSEDLETVKIADFGIARLDDTALTQTGLLTGTPPYMSPEQFRGETLDGRSDLFSVGALLYELLTRQRPFQGNSVPAIMMEVISNTPSPPSAISKNIPGPISDVIMRALEKDSDHRFASGKEMADALENAKKRSDVASLPDDINATITATSIRPFVANGGKTSIGKEPLPWFRYAGLVSVLLMVGIAIFFIFRESPKTSPQKKVDKVDVETDAKKRAKAEQEKQQQEEIARIEKENLKQERAKTDSERLAQEKARTEQEGQQQKEEAGRIEREKLEQEKDRVEQERRKQERAKAEKEKLAQESAQAVEQARLKQEEIARIQQRELQQKKANAEKERLKQEKIQAERKKQDLESARIERERLRRQREKVEFSQKKTSPPTSGDSRALVEILNRFSLSYEKKDLAALKKISTMPRKKALFLGQLFKDYETIKVSIKDLSIIGHSVYGLISFTELTSRKQNPVLPSNQWKDTRFTLHKKEGQWGKILWE